jgi:mersacidin/lichenicidin family type 2 lantibiotic
MTHLDIIRAWKDEEYRLGLSEAERAQLPAHPAGIMELTDAQLDVAGGSWVTFALGVLAGVVGNAIYARLPSAEQVGQALQSTANFYGNVEPGTVF